MYFSIFKTILKIIFFHNKNEKILNFIKIQLIIIKKNNNENNNKIKLYENQLQIYLKSKEKSNNSIIFIETGKGKTLISILLIADLLNIGIFTQKTNIKNKKIIFFVCE